MAGTLKFVPCASSFDFSFWTKLSWLKLNTWKLDSSSRAIRGFVGQELSLSAASFGDDDGPAGARSVAGELVLFDSAAAFKSANKQAVLDGVGANVVCKWGGRRCDTVKPPTFVVLCFPDIKEHSYMYWVAVPVIVAVALPPTGGVSDVAQGVVTAITAASVEDVSRAVSLVAAAGQATDVAFALLPPSEPALTLPLGDPSVALRIRDEAGASPDAILSALLYDDVGLASGTASLATADAAAASICQLGWLSRNAVTMLAWACGARTLRLLVLPATASAPGVAPSGIWLTVAFADAPAAPPLPPPEVDVAPAPPSLPPGLAVVGWELNAKGQPGPRLAHLRRQMGSEALADASADLNLSLMRWRMLPGLDLARLSTARCLLLGAGTLGCHVARDLVAWGFRHLTLVDSGDVSYSNPVRQPLYVFADVGRPKAVVAAEALAAIRPGIDATARVLSIPMPDHPLSGGEEGVRRTMDAVDELGGLIASHDVVFLMTDTRESRWLPTILASEAGKLAITVALGFDSYLVMRHGVRGGPAPATAPAAPPSEVEPAAAPGGAAAGAAAIGGSPSSPALGCYFCGDVVGPLNSTLGRTLDQQCTVTRPGCAPIASAMAVELFVSLLHHPLGGHAPAEVSPLELSSRTSTPLGALPHQIRGFLTHYAHLLMAAPGFDKCTACSSAVVSALRSDGAAFLRRAFDEGAAFLEGVTGLDELQASTTAMVLEDMEEFEEEGGAGDAGDGC